MSKKEISLFSSFLDLQNSFLQNTSIGCFQLLKSYSTQQYIHHIKNYQINVQIKDRCQVSLPSLSETELFQDFKNVKKGNLYPPQARKSTFGDHAY